jgi:molybdopterin-biosynthesis enzyme MoeA-like protein
MTQFGLYVIGDEILSGRRTDRHMPHVIALLRERGLGLAWAKFLPDEREVIERALRESLAAQMVVFCCGGIGATPDDQTRQAAAAALGVELVLHPEARELIARAVAKRGLHDLNNEEGRRVLMMGEFPRGARLLPNTYNGIPGFAVERHYFTPGFPVMAWPMIEWALDTELAEFIQRDAHVERSIIVFGVPESSMIPLLQEIERDHAPVRTFSLPSVGDGADGRPARRHIELGVKGPREQALAAFELMCARLKEAGLETQGMPTGVGTSQ